MNPAENIFGPNIGALKVKITSSKPKPIKYDVMGIKTELIKQHKDLTHYMYIMFVNEISMINGIDRTIRYQYLV